MKVLLYCKEKVQIETKGQKTLLMFLKPMTLEENQLVYVLPCIENALPFCFYAGKENKFVKHTIFNEFILAEIIDFPQVFEGKYFSAKSISGGSVNVIGCPYKFNINLKKTTYSFDLPQTLEDITFYENKNAVVLEAVQDNQNYACVFHKQSKKFQSFLGSVQVGENMVEAVIPKNTLAGHGEAIKIDLSGDTPTLLQSDGVYIGGCPKSVPPFLVHIAFFEAVREKDFALARTYVERTLAEKLSPETLEEFFGEFDLIKVLSQNQEISLALIKNTSKTMAVGRVFDVKFFGGLIVDIQEKD